MSRPELGPARAGAAVVELAAKVALAEARRAPASDNDGNAVGADSIELVAAGEVVVVVVRHFEGW